MKRINVLITFILLQVFPLALLAQQSSLGWSQKFETNKVFIENKGQFSLPGSSGNVLYAFDHSSAKIYFTKSGVEYSLTQFLPNEKKSKKEKFCSVEKWREKEAEEREAKFKSDAVGFTWEGANPDVQIIAQNPTEDYFSYSFKNSKGIIENHNHISGYKKIIYKNLYPKIDVEYVFHETDGIKYSLILHPGADISKVKMKYSERPKISANGDMYIKTRFGNIVEHAPVSFYAENNKIPVTSEFIVNSNIVSFNIVNWDNTKSMIIDPWVQMPDFTNSNWDCVWECEKDSLGNVYIIGGTYPLQLKKYNSAGAIQWSYNTPYDTTAWLGTFATDKAGNSYITNGSIAAIHKVNSSGGFVWDNPNPGGLLGSDEFWGIAFNCDQSKLIIGGTINNGSITMPVLKGGIFNIDAATGNVLDSQVVATGSMYSMPISIQEVRAITNSDNGKFYFLTLDTIGCVNDIELSSNPIVFKNKSGYHLSYKSEKWRYNNSGIMVIKAGRDFLYTQNGVMVHKRSLMNGAVLDSAVIPNGSSTIVLGQHQLGNAGIDIDSCGNVYIGSCGRVLKYDGNLNLIDSVIVPFNVYDITVNTGGNIIACGSLGDGTYFGARPGYVQSMFLSACKPMASTCCNASINNPNNFCFNDTIASLSSTTPGGTWSGNGITDSFAGTFDPSIAGVGVHTIVYTLPCGSDSINLTVDSCYVLSACQESTGNITVSDGVGTYTWEYYIPASSTPINTQAECLACDSNYSWMSGSCYDGLFSVTFCNTPATWIVFDTATTVTPPSFPVRVTDLYGTTLTIQNIDSLPECLSKVPITNNNIEGVSIYPNPNKDILFIDLPINENYNISIFDISGRKVIETNGKSNKITINTSNFKKGEYLINIKTKYIPNYNSKLFIK